MERTFIMIKPDGVNRGLVGEIIRRFEHKGFKLVGMKMMSVPRELAEKHYDALRERSFFPGLIEFITSAPVIAMVWEGENIVTFSRKLIGVTDPGTADPGTIRGDYGMTMGRNLIHGSDAIETAQREIHLWFNEEDLVDWHAVNHPWLYE
ncbi:nucleoside-diphosphate kinase [Spirulina sp. CS-785/01]|uniref:nucleoside-diphosphate kinase n=1 Tax=Spirulina sp. CS-785/01 TaxID=3021716 RepID=UPI00232B8A79|nr:nucleoside-diphosphate kinase [Spirulina sp. CS-785/01]MDB9313841.1 nucleoside-diphosphate kinase [Spirulina sp. CS-785/01]